MCVCTPYTQDLAELRSQKKEGVFEGKDNLLKLLHNERQARKSAQEKTVFLENLTVNLTEQAEEERRVAGPAWLREMEGTKVTRYVPFACPPHAQL